MRRWNRVPIVLILPEGNRDLMAIDYAHTEIGFHCVAFGS